VNGGTGWNTGAGAGTMFLKGATDTWGTLVVDNRGIASAPGSTPLPVVPQGVVDAVAGAVLTDHDANLRANDWTGYLMIRTSRWFGRRRRERHPRGDGELAHDVHARRAARGLHSAGKTYRGVHVFDNLQIQGKADVDVAGDLWITEGDLFSDDALTFSLNGGLKAVRLDLQTRRR